MAVAAAHIEHDGAHAARRTATSVPMPLAREPVDLAVFEGLAAVTRQVTPAPMLPAPARW